MAERELFTLPAFMAILDGSGGDVHPHGPDATAYTKSAYGNLTTMLADYIRATSIDPSVGYKKAYTTLVGLLGVMPTPARVASDEAQAVALFSKELAEFAETDEPPLPDVPAVLPATDGDEPPADGSAPVPVGV